RADAADTDDTVSEIDEVVAIEDDAPIGRQRGGVLAEDGRDDLAHALILDGEDERAVLLDVPFAVHDDGQLFHLALAGAPSRLLERTLGNPPRQSWAARLPPGGVDAAVPDLEVSQRQRGAQRLAILTHAETHGLVGL